MGCYFLRLERGDSAVRLFSQAIIFKKRKCQPRNRTLPKMIPRQWIMPTTTLAGRDPAPPTKSQRLKGVPSPAPDPENDRNRRNARPRNAEKGVPLAHAVAPRAERAVRRAAEEVDPRAERAVRSRGGSRSKSRGKGRSTTRVKAHCVRSHQVKAHNVKSHVRHLCKK